MKVSVGGTFRSETGDFNKFYVELEEDDWQRLALTHNIKGDPPTVYKYLVMSAEANYLLVAEMVSRNVAQVEQLEDAKARLNAATQQVAEAMESA